MVKVGTDDDIPVAAAGKDSDDVVGLRPRHGPESVVVTAAGGKESGRFEQLSDEGLAPDRPDRARGPAGTQAVGQQSDLVTEILLGGQRCRIRGADEVAPGLGCRRQAGHEQENADMEKFHFHP